MLSLAVLAALEFRVQDEPPSEGQMVTGSLSKDMPALPKLPSLGDSEGNKGGVLVPLDNGTLRGSAGTSRIVIGVAELDEFDDTRVCEVTLKMGGQSKVIATITRGTLERGFSLRTCKLDQYGDFEYGDSETGLTYSYNEGEAQSIDLTWPEGRTDFSMPILVEANYECAFWWNAP